ncbi:MAG TPA: hypothetical protein PL033_05345 [Candidatus Brocadiia bacterium]|nr:hypothetical protein [Candidatus Brocadiia bacterium]
MGDMPKITLKELVTLYELEPSIRDIVVEGMTDIRIVRNILKCLHLTVVNVRDAADIVATEVVTNGANNKNGVISLAEYFQARLGKNTLQVTCIVDTDFDRYLEKCYECDLLLSTDYTSMEMYCVDPESVQKVMDFAFRLTRIASDDLLKTILPVLESLFLIRLANEHLALGLTWKDFTKCCSVDKKGNGNLNFDQTEFLRRYVANRRELQDTVSETINQLVSKLDNNWKCKVRFHDFAALLSWYCKKRWNADCRAEQVKSHFLCAADFKKVAGEALFQNLMNRITRNSPAN